MNSNDIQILNTINDLFFITPNALKKSVNDFCGGINTTSDNYPPTNTYMPDENSGVIEMATAGFKRSELEVSQQGQVLTVKGSINKEGLPENHSIKFLSMGLGKRQFKRTFTLSKYVSVDKVSYTDGVLNISLLREIPKEERPKLFEIK